MTENMTVAPTWAEINLDNIKYNLNNIKNDINNIFIIKTNNA